MLGFWVGRFGVVLLGLEVGSAVRIGHYRPC